MDVFSHGLWAGAIYKLFNKKVRKPLSVGWAAFWGVFPDVFTFAIPLALMVYNLIFGGLSFSELSHPETMEPLQRDTLFVFRLADSLYNLTHSLIVFLLVFALLIIIFRRPIWVLGGWLIHIIMDIPTHSYQFYPTPFLWPLSKWKLDGFSWGNKWFIITNYSLLIIAYLILWKWKRRKVKKLG